MTFARKQVARLFGLTQGGVTIRLNRSGFNPGRNELTLEQALALATTEAEVIGFAVLAYDILVDFGGVSKQVAEARERFKRGQKD